MRFLDHDGKSLCVSTFMFSARKANMNGPRTDTKERSLTGLLYTVRSNDLWLIERPVQ